MTMGEVVARVQTLSDDQKAGVNQGMGGFEFNPQVGRTYELKIDAPAGMHGQDEQAPAPLLPATKSSGVVLHHCAGREHGRH